ncbi:hypothetical protein [Actinoplanes sp. NPDC051494]|uniref:hypothetical protein n=1 Tax=Actinoplanes sp. NPDC051494 TaxID=3363907 RepID=UPI0037AC9A14
MTAVLTRPAPPSAPPVMQKKALTAVPWVLTGATFVTALLLNDVTPAQVAVYATYLVLGIVLPGTLVHRALRGSRGNLPEDLGLGAATGLLVQLLGWALAAATGLQQMLWCWPVLVLVAFLAVPSLRRHWRIAEPQPLPLRWSWLICAGLLFVIAWGVNAWQNVPLPPVHAEYYVDLMYHLALVHEMTRSMPFEVPQLAGDALRYHYLSDADMAAASMITGLSPELVLMRLWMVPIGATALLVVATLAREVSGKWWAGPLAGTVAFIGSPLSLGAPVSAYGNSSLVFASPSQTYAMPLLGLLTLIAVDVLRRRALGPAWFLAPVLALACAGSKSSALPPLVAGLALAVVMLWIRDRVFPRAAAGLLVAVLIPMLVGAKLFAGGGAGTLGVQPFSVLRWMDPYSRTLGSSDGIAPNGFLPPGLQDAAPRAWVYVAGIIGWWLLMQAPRLLGLGGIGARRIRQDPVAWLLGGMIAAGVGAAWALWHPSASQVYFFLCALPFGVVLSTWFLADQVRRWWVPVAGLLAGAAWTLAAPDVLRPTDVKSWGQWSWALGLPVLRTLAFVVAGAILVLVLRRSFRSLVVAVLAATLGGSLTVGITYYTKSLFLTDRPAAVATARWTTAAEMEAALWLNRNTGRDDVVATNVHCAPVTRAEPCDARAFWVSGLGGRRTLVESWGYSDDTVAANGVGGRKYVFQPAPDPAEFALNQRAFSAADPTDLTTLRETYGVKWLLADTRAGQVSPRLATLADIRFTSGTTTVYELR